VVRISHIHKLRRLGTAREPLSPTRDVQLHKHAGRPHSVFILAHALACRRRERHILRIDSFIMEHTMTRLPQLVLLCVVAFPTVAAPQSSRAAPAPEDSAVVVWIRKNSIPLRTLDAGSGFTDLAPIETILQHARIVGLGEATHGSDEFQRVKHRLFQFLVQQMGYTVFVIEAAFSDAQPMNDYLLHGKGSRADVLSKLGYLAWDTEEFAAMVDWMRAYNRTAPESKKIRFFGVDLYRNSVGRSKVVAALRRVLPTAVATTDSLFRTLAEQERRWPGWDTTVIDAARPQLDTLARELEARRAATPAVLTPAQWDDVIQLVNVMRYMAVRKHRDQYLAQNMVYLIDHEAPGTKFVLWAHNDHITKDSLSLGYFLRQRYGDAYYALALYFNEGAYLTRSIQPLDGFKITKKPPAAPSSLESFLVRAQLPRFFLDLRAPAGTPAVDAWQRTSREAYGGVWAFQDPTTLASLNDTLKVRDWYDGLLFVKESTPTHPTANARRIVERKESF